MADTIKGDLQQRGKPTLAAPQQHALLTRSVSCTPRHEAVVVLDCGGEFGHGATQPDGGRVRQPSRSLRHGRAGAVTKAPRSASRRGAGDKPRPPTNQEDPMTDVAAPNERDPEIHEAFLSLACAILCFRRLRSF